MIRPAKIFYSYSHRDEYLRKELDIHLTILKRLGIIETWHDRKIIPGEDWKQKIDSNLLEADIVLLLISCYFLASDYCYEKEMNISLQRHEKGFARVIPIFLRPCYWQDTPFSRLQCLPENAKPVTSWDDPHEAWTEIAKNIKDVAEKVISSDQFKKKIDFKEDVSFIYSKDISTYYEYLIKQYETVSWVQRAIILHAYKNQKSIVNIHDELFNSAIKSSKSLIFILGDFGSGKTWVLKRLARDIADHNLKVFENKILPFFVPLTKTIYYNHIHNLCKGLGEWENLLETKEKGQSFLFLFDGLDEIAYGNEDKVWNVLESLFNQAPSNSRFMISCRTQAFEKLSKVINIEIPHKEPVEEEIEWAIDASLNNTIAYELCPITSKVVEKYLLSGPAKTYWSNISGKEAYFQLAKQPVMLQLIEKALPEFSEREKKFTIEDIYRIAIEAWTRIDSHCRKLKLSPKTWREILRTIAGLSFPYGYTFLDKISFQINISVQWEDLINALINANIFELDNQEKLRFTHHSFFEYSYALLLNHQLENFDAEFLTMSNLVYSYPVNRFLIPMLKDSLETKSNATSKLISRLQPHIECETGKILSRPVSFSEFRQFMIESGWRKLTGFGTWPTFVAEDGTKGFSSNFDQIYISTDQKFEESELPITGVSWYDAYQFCKWVGGRLPTYEELIKVSDFIGNEVETEWTSTWYDEIHSQMLVIKTNNMSKYGINPDIRSKTLSFRVIFPQITK